MSNARARVQRHGPAIERVCLLIVFSVALILRTYKLEQPLMWCDESESAINAMTILEHGYPADSYLGIPIFENILTEPWPEHPEYEFRDSSYSRNGVAVYHGWLPLYAMAGSMKLFGVEPATDPTQLVSHVTPRQMTLKTIAPRLPSVVFGMIFLVLIFRTGCEMYGKPAGWAALIGASIAVPVVNIARQARYYSLTLMLCMACCLMMWRMVKRGRWIDYVLGAVCAAMLFHTHVLTFGIVCAAGMLLLPTLFKQARSLPKLITAAAIVLVAVVPWGIATGFFGQASHVPKAVSMLNMPRDLFMYAIDRWPVTLFLMIGTTWILIVRYFGHKLPAKLAAPFVACRGASLFLVGWCFIGWLAFMVLIPAASLWLPRAYLGIIGPGLVLGAILFAGLSRAIGPKFAVPMACVMFAGFIMANARSSYYWTRELDKAERWADMIGRMCTWELRPGTKIYCTPSDQLTFTYYSDLPVQSIAPVRREFLEKYPDDVVVIESFTRFYPLTGEDVKDLALKHHVALDDEEAYRWSKRLNARALADYAMKYAASVDVPLDPLPPFAQDAFDRKVELTQFYSGGLDNPAGANPAVFRGYAMSDYSWWWQVFFYRFAGFEDRALERLNYLGRLKNARAVVLPTSYVVYFSPGSSGSAGTAHGSDGSDHVAETTDSAESREP